MIYKYEKFDARELRKALYSIWSQFDAVNESFGLTYRPGAEDRIRDSNGNSKNESLFTEFLEEAKKTYFYEVFQKINTDYQKVNRFRVVCLKPFTCYSIHRDNVDKEFVLRYQIPIIPNKFSFLLLNTSVEKTGFKLDKEASGFESFQMLEAGRIYGFDSTYYHTYINGDAHNDRVHLVIS